MLNSDKVNEIVTWDKQLELKDMILRDKSHKINSICSLTSESQKEINMKIKVIYRH